jgi:hypothetical protein
VFAARTPAAPSTRRGGRYWHCPRTGWSGDTSWAGTAKRPRPPGGREDGADSSLWRRSRLSIGLRPNSGKMGLRLRKHAKPPGGLPGRHRTRADTLIRTRRVGSTSVTEERLGGPGCAKIRPADSPSRFHRRGGFATARQRYFRAVAAWATETRESSGVAPAEGGQPSNPCLRPLEPSTSAPMRTSRQLSHNQRSRTTIDASAPYVLL